jgi:ABC-type dipeptide/oligopeptide/nickel transport system permease component
MPPVKNFRPPLTDLFWHVDYASGGGAPGGLRSRQTQIRQDYTIRLYGIVIYCIPDYRLELMLQMILGIWLDIFQVSVIAES